MENVDASPRVKKLMEKLSKDVSFTEMDIHDKTFTKSAIAAEWLGMYYSEMNRKKKMSKAIDELKEKILQRKYETRRNGGLLNETALKLEVERELKGSSEYQSIKDSLAEQDEVIAFITEARSVISQLGFDLKNAIEVLKLEKI